jgi:hypothetical protein
VYPALNEWRIHYEAGVGTYTLYTPDGRIVGVYSSLGEARAAMRALQEASLAESNWCIRSKG